MSPRLRQRRFQLLPLRGAGSPFTDLQGRLPGESTAPAELADLISSIGTVGVLEPVLVEEITQPDGAPPAMKLAAGERRLRAVRWGAVHQPDNPHFAVLPAIVVPGPLSEEERRIWQLVENLARTDLQPGELAAALLLHRGAVLLGKLLAAGITVPTDVYQLDDPVARFHALERLRGTNTDCAAPWSEVLTRLGLQLSPRKARELVRAFAELPRELSEEMDAAQVALHTRIRFADLRRGRAEAADGIWAAVKHRGQPHLLPAAVTTATDTDADPEEALTTAESLHEQANAARAAKLRRPTPTTGQRDEGEAAGEEITTMVDPQLVDNALTALRALATAVAHGERLDRHDHRSLQLLVDQISATPAAA